jgi:dihydrodipicolinate synthase/N-acetylneuraminate lyase
MQDVQAQRAAMVARFFPDGIPKLWCPAIVHYNADGTMDVRRMEQHLRKMSVAVKAFLVFGSTGDGWELDDQEKKAVISRYLQWTKQYHVRILLGVLHPEKGKSLQEMLAWIDWCKESTRCRDAVTALETCGICGFTVCPPAGKDVPQYEIQRELMKILDVNVPVALYQLPQITNNEIAPDTLLTLARQYPNFYLFKDTSGRDLVRLSKLDYQNVFFVRGAEGEYERWYGKGKQSYDGFLLSSANCFSDLLLEMLQRIAQGDDHQAREISAGIQRVMDAMFGKAADLEGGNVFTNANKCIDHCMAYGPRWREYPMPMRHCGQKIPEDYVGYANRTLADENLLPTTGYVSD